MKKYFLILLALLPLFAVAEKISPYEWEKTRSRFKLNSKESQYGEYVLKQHMQYDFMLEDNQFVMYSTMHRIVLVNTSEAIQKHNRIVISMGSTIELTDLRARSINKEGKVVDFDKNNLKELKNEDGDKAFRIFAIEGVEIGSEIEYFFTRKMYASLFDRVFTQTDAPVMTSSFQLSCPSHLQFDFKSYAGYPDITKENGEERNVYRASLDNIPAMKKEEFSYFDPNRKRVEFKLAYNNARSKARLYTWDEAGKNFFSRLTTLNKDEEKAMEKFFKTLGDKPTEKPEVRIKNIEQKIKTSIQVDKGSRDAAVTELNSVLKYKIASREGITKLMLAAYAKAGIPVHIVITCSREDVKFDGSFDSWSFLDEYIFYFPETKGFLAPYFFENRYPFVPAEFTAHKGLFIEPFTLGGVKSGLASVKDIPAIEYAQNYDNLDIEVRFNGELTSNDISQKREFGGYNASYFTPYYSLMSKQDQLELVENITKQTAPDAKLGKWTAAPVARGIQDNFLFEVDFSSTHFLEKAGPRLLFKAGELIGAQTQLYRDEERVTPVENEFNRMYDRKIRIHIPSGYTIKNTNDLKFDVQYKDGDRVPFVFKSSYTMQGDILEVTIHEYYEDIYAPLNRFEDFRKVINAAADFNKVTLVLEKKK